MSTVLYIPGVHPFATANVTTGAAVSHDSVTDPGYLHELGECEREHVAHLQQDPDDGGGPQVPSDGVVVGAEHAVPTGAQTRRKGTATCGGRVWALSQFTNAVALPGWPCRRI